jgi:hypothetical protein
MREAPAKIGRAIMLALIVTLILEGCRCCAADGRARPADGVRFGQPVRRSRACARRSGMGAVGGGRRGTCDRHAIIAWVLACARFFYSTAATAAGAGRSIAG